MSLEQKELRTDAHASVLQGFEGLTVVGLFAGIGGIELGLQQSGHHSMLLCEIDPAAQAVLRERFPETDVSDDVRALKELPRVDVVAAGFPCQDLSQAGQTRGINGKNSGLVDNIFRLIGHRRRSPTWLLIENVPFMLQLERGRAMHHLTRSLETLGFRWAYRIIDARSFGLPQRRRRVIMLASRTRDPREVLLVEDAGAQTLPSDASAYGFYWTEGNRGLGWAVDAVPTLKGGSTVGIPSPPAIWLYDESRIVTPDIRDAERLQGFRAQWTRPAVQAGGREGIRWKLVGNAVCVPVARWIGNRFKSPKPYDESLDERLGSNDAWPAAAWGAEGRTYRANVSEWPVCRRSQRLLDFLKYPTKPLSERAAAGFLRRATASSLRFRNGFLDAIAQHVDDMQQSD